MQTANYKTKNGFTLLEVLIGTGIIAIMALLISQVYFAVVSQIDHYREQSVITSLADQYMEIARNLPYSQVGTLNGSPHGSLPDQPSPTNVTVNGNSYQIYYVVNFVDDPADGTALAGTDSIPNDYKQVKLYIKNTNSGVLNDFVTNIVPQGLEVPVGRFGGTLSIQVINAVGQPVPDATIHITNTALVPDINLTRTSDANGNWVEVALPASNNNYHIVVTKAGYSTDQTYPVTMQNPNPVKGDATIVNSQITSISFSIDKLSNLTLALQNQTCSPLPSVGLELQGSKLIGTSPSVLKFDNTYTSDVGGLINLPNLEWDTYFPQITGNTYMVYGSSPTQQVTILPNTSETFNLMLGPATANSLLVIVKDASTSNVIEGASVELQSTSQGYDTTKISGGSMWSQQDWSGGAGQTDFANNKQYFSDDGGINNNPGPSGISLASLNGSYVSSGTLVSSTFDTGTSASTYTTLDWQPTSQDPATSLSFQIATADDDTVSTVWNFIGPDGTSGTYYTVPGTTISSTNNNHRYIRYKAYLSTTDPSKTPVLTSVNVNYVSGCFTPGQVMFAGLSGGTDYVATVSASGYQPQIQSNLTIGGYNDLEVLMAQ